MCRIASREHSVRVRDLQEVDPGRASRLAHPRSAHTGVDDVHPDVAVYLPDGDLASLGLAVPKDVDDTLPEYGGQHSTDSVRESRAIRTSVSAATSTKRADSSRVVAHRDEVSHLELSMPSGPGRFRSPEVRSQARAAIAVNRNRDGRPQTMDLPQDPLYALCAWTAIVFTVTAHTRASDKLISQGLT